MRHCVPSNVSSGLASLPLPYVYVDGVPNLSRPTHPYLPSGERLNGSLSFEQIVSYYTTTDITPTEMQALGYEKLRSLYKQVIQSYCRGEQKGIKLKLLGVRRRAS